MISSKKDFINSKKRNVFPKESFFYPKIEMTCSKKTQSFW